MAVPSLAAIRARWPALTSTAISDDNLTLMRTDAGNRVPSGLPDDDDTAARIHLTAHLALGFIQSSTLQGMVSGTQTAQSASFMERSVTRATKATASYSPRSPWEAELMGTVPGRLYLGIVNNVIPLAVYYGSAT